MAKYSDILMDHFLSPRNSGHMEGADLIGLVGVPGQGPFLVLYLQIHDGVVVRASYQTHGCGASIASGSILTTLIVGRTVEDCSGLTAEQLAEALSGVPPDKAHCPAMAIAALHAALTSHEAACNPGE